MSRMQNGANGYANGYSNSHSNNHYEAGPLERNNGESQDVVGGPRDRRAGGYGGFSNDGLSAPPTPDRQPPSWMSEDANGSGRRRRQAIDHTLGGDTGRNRERSRPRANGRDGYGEGPGARKIEGIVQHIQERWDIMTKDDCVPVQVALQLMDFSSLGRGNDYYDFQDTNKQLHKSLQAIVNEHHQGFNSSIGTFHKIQSSIQQSQNRVRTLKESLIRAKSNLSTAKPELPGLASSSQNFDDMLQVLAQIERIQLLPEQLEARVSDKHFLSAVDILQNALRLIGKPNLENIGALADLRVYFTNQEASLTDILIEELHDHLYLKSPYCQDRWKAFLPRSKDPAGIEEDASSMQTGIRPLYQFLNELNTSTSMDDDASRNPEINSFEYIHMILESLNRMGRLDVAVDRVEQRLPIELFAIVDRTNREVDLRHPIHLRGSQRTELSRPDQNTSESGGRSDVLHDLLSTLYSKFEAIAEGHRAVHDVVAGIVKREGLRQSSALTGGFREVWKLYQSEMRSLLHDYLATDGNPLYRTGQVSASRANIFQRGQRDKSKRLFKLSEMDTKTTGLASEEEELNKILQASVPGLVSKSQGRSVTDQNDRSTTQDGPATGHKLLVEPSVFNITLLLPPSLSFLRRLKDIVPPNSDVAISTLTSFLDDFLVNVFQPQFDETVTELCAQSYTELDAFQQDPQWSQHARNPIFKGASTFFSLTKAFCKMLDNLPQDQNFTQLIISQLVAYYDKCCGWYRTLVTRTYSQGDMRLKPAAAMVESGEVREVVEAIWQGDGKGYGEMFQNEYALLSTMTNETPLEPFDIISDRKSVAALCLLHTSMQWLASCVSRLRHVTPDQTRRGSINANRSLRWSLLGSQKSSTGEEQSVYLPMTEETAIAFDKIVASFRGLAMTALFTLHIDIRCGVIHMITRTLNAPYLLDQPANEPDPSVLTLNADLVNFDDKLTMYLPDREHRFIISGLGFLLDNLLVGNASQISAMNINGCGRMQLNILVLQQNFKSIEDEVTLARSTQFFELFGEGALAILEKAKESSGKDLGFNLDELKVLIKLCHSEGLKSQQRDVALQAKRTSNDHLLQLSESMWNS